MEWPVGPLPPHVDPAAIQAKFEEGFAPVLGETWAIVAIHGGRLVFERYGAGRTADELAKLFDAFPAAQLCFDLGHAWQVDHTMTEGRQILRRFRDRIRQLHVSEVNTNSEHVPLTLTTVTAFRRLLDLLPDVPWILEAVTAPDKIGDEIQYVRESFSAAMDFVAD